MKKIWTFFFLSCLLFGLNINESVQKALEKSHKIKEQRHILSSLKVQLGIYEGAYYPKIDLGNESRYDTHNKLNNKTSLQLSANLFNGMKDYNVLKSQEQNIQAQDEEIAKMQGEVKYAIKKLYTQTLLVKGLLETSHDAKSLSSPSSTLSSSKSSSEASK